jgi:hypothetical protein
MAAFAKSWRREGVPQEPVAPRQKSSSLSEDAAALVSNATNAGRLDIGTIQFGANHSFDIPPCIRHGSRFEFFGRRCANGKAG